ncbi:hypothetical protein BN59_02289 [Legionella massiliensis]|uniref:Uncharacterized protein n=1 Tax=Legionella massiliensis TaxID=1034943 RepID=A0A078L1U9_9GAMM|nr:hypothetical protein [Legionella massiliensis]CDZ77993.1 hypothetical protein BN59_02289 [Legionella massiliensis]CEE13731.1 hypothetical protein BN1094_02289 [Legionella massiliensis]
MNKNINFLAGLSLILPVVGYSQTYNVINQSGYQVQIVSTCTGEGAIPYDLSNDRNYGIPPCSSNGKLKVTAQITTMPSTVVSCIEADFNGSDMTQYEYTVKSASMPHRIEAVCYKSGEHN